MAMSYRCYDDENEWRELEISSDLHVYPCCTLHALHFLDGTFYDEYLDGLPKNWNSLKHHTMEEIIKTMYILSCGMLRNVFLP